MIHRNVTRVVFNSTEITNNTQNVVSGDEAFVITTSDFLYVGYQGKFASRHFQFGTANTNSLSLTVEYWDGDAWTDVEDVVDQTLGFTQDGFVSWQNKDDWETTTVAPASDRELYYVRVSVSADASAGTTLRSVVNIFADDTSLRVYYPELVSDSRYLPVGRTNFLEQHVAAKDLVVLRLKQRRVITDESQIIDINPVSQAAVHAVADIILSPIEQDEALLDRVRAAFANELNQLNLGTDQDGDGISEDAERNGLGFTRVLRRG